jgi:putative ABC transport system substrate-binding protein
MKIGTSYEPTGYSRQLKLFALSLCAMFFALWVSVQAQQPAEKIPRIGIVTGISSDPSSRIQIFRQALQELGYLEGENILFEYRDNEGNRDRVPGIVAELVSLKVNIIFSTQAIVIREAKQATKTIPIVMAITPDPVASGLVDSLARPG